MPPIFFSLITFINQNSDLKLLISKMQESNDDFWLVGGCLRNSLLNLPQVDIDIAGSSDPAPLARSWSAEVSGRWFWLDEKRKQCRVLLPSGFTLDFAPLRASSIIKDLYLRDFTVNALALPVDKSFPDSKLLDPLSGINHLQKQQLHSCSGQSFFDDPLRMLKGIRHAVTLEFEISTETQKQIISSKHLLSDMAGERIREELSKIFNSERAVKGLELLIDTDLLGILFGSAGESWDEETAIAKISLLDEKINEAGVAAVENLSALHEADSFSTRAIFLLSQLLNVYLPQDLPGLLHNRLRLSCQQQRLLNELQVQPDLEILSLVGSIEGKRRQALLAERLEPFFFEKILYWAVCEKRVTLNKAVELQKSFNHERTLGHVPALLNGKLISTLLGITQGPQIGKWQEMLKLAEIKGEIDTSLQAENWLKSKLSFDNKEA